MATLFASRGTIMLTAGDEFGRTQAGNNNAYAQDNETTWLDWEERDLELEAFTAGLAAFRAEHPQIAGPAFLEHAEGVSAVEWLDLAGAPMTPASWHDAEGFELRLRLADGRVLCVRIDRSARSCSLSQIAGA
jgi:glycogen operon protein